VLRVTLWQKYGRNAAEKEQIQEIMIAGREREEGGDRKKESEKKQKHSRMRAKREQKHNRNRVKREQKHSSTRGLTLKSPRSTSRWKMPAPSRDMAGPVARLGASK
jgi:hypothetical protein